MSDDEKELAKNEMRTQWQFHRNAMRDLIIHSLLQTVRDVDGIARRGQWEYDTGFRSENVPIVKDRLKHWLKNSRFEFWTEWVDIDARTAAERIEQILEGEVDVSKIYRSDKK